MKEKQSYNHNNKIKSLIFYLLLCLSFYPVCTDDNFNKTIRDESNFIYYENDNRSRSPIVADNIITITDITSSDIGLAWNPAVDGDSVTPRNELEYKVVSSESNNIYSLEYAETNGNTVMDWTADTTSTTASGLIESTTYFFNVLVRDGDDNKTIYQTNFATTAEAPETGPIPGGFGIITTSGITATSIQLFWNPSIDADGVTPQNELEYKLVSSDSNDINTVANAGTNGDIVMDWTTNITSTIAIGLSESTTYFFNIIVRDKNENEAVYTTVSATTLGAVIYMFNAGQYQGNMADSASTAREDLDDICEYAKTNSYPTMPCFNIRAFISIDETDTIANIPSTLTVPSAWPVKGPYGDQIAGGWADLLDGEIDTTLLSAEITSDQWWSGSNTDGSYNSDNCSAWTSTSATGAAGHHDSTGENWLYQNSPNCNALRYLLCICW